MKLPFARKLTEDQRFQREVVRAGKAAMLGFLLGWVLTSAARDRGSAPYRGVPAAGEGD
jgi:hypothetical protein